MFNKGFIKDNGQIRNCSSNIAKMNILELMYVKIFQWNFLGYTMYIYFECVKTAILNVIILLLNTVLLILFPISFFVMCYLEIIKERKYIKQVNNTKKV
jgi:hypothetical protein